MLVNITFRRCGGWSPLDSLDMQSLLNNSYGFFVVLFRSDEEDPSGSKYRRLEDDGLQDKERFAR